MPGGAHCRFVPNRAALEAFKAHLKLQPCPRCGAAETLNAHGALRGYSDPGQGKLVRGWRIYCSNRHRRTGCGRTFAVLLAEVIWGFVVRALALEQFVKGVLSGLCRKTAWGQVSHLTDLCLRSGYRLWHRFRLQQTRLRSVLFRQQPPADSRQQLPLAQCFEHLSEVMSGQRESLFGRFQELFQRSLMG